MKHSSLATFPLAAALLVGASTAFGQGAATTSQDELYVIGQRLEETTPQQLAQFGNRLEMLTADQLQLGGFDDLSQALQMQVPGLYVAPKNGPFDYMNCSLQGSRCEDVLWLVDGVRTANRLYNTTAPLDTIPAHMIERVEVLYGGQGIFYGTQSTAGVVNVVTKSFGGAPAGSLGIGFDENNGTHLNGDYRTAFGDHQVVFFASQDESDGFQPVPDEGYQPSGTDRDRSYDALTLGAKYAYDFTDRSRLSLLYQRTDNDLDFARPYWAAVSKNERIDDWITAKWDYTASDNVDLYVKAYWHDWDTEFTEIYNDIGPGGAPTGTQSVNSDHLFWGFEDYGVTAVADVRTDNSFEYAVGYDYQRFWGEDEVWLIEDKTETAQAVYGQIRTSDSQLENTQLALGLRYNTTSGNADKTVWNFSGQHDLNDRLYLRGQVGTSFRLPDAEELYLRDCCEVGNPNLDPEEGSNLEVGIGGTADAGQGLSWQFIYFTREVDNLINIDFNNPAFPDGRFENFDETVESSGWEFGVTAALNKMMTLSFDHTSTDAELGGTNVQVQDIPESITKLGWNYVGMDVPLEINVAVLNVGDMYDVVGGGVGRVDHGKYTVVDVGAGYYLDAERRHRIGGRLENALDEDYASSIGRGRRDLDNSSYAYRNLGAPRTLHATYTYRF
ncbi:MAG TPA: TonB-dependent receptor [Gammaproteobacteria bacterium]|nr:TonB-dependent receptor [Gammaproteobacteria bacterium]